MTYYIQRLAIEGFRGINNAGAPLTFTFDDDTFTSIFGANAQGKTSIYQALCYALAGEIPALEELHTAEGGPDHYVNHFHPNARARIELTLRDSMTALVTTFAIERTRSGTRTVTADPPVTDADQLLRSIYSPHSLLDNATFARFVSDSPLARGRVFSGLLGLEELSEARQALELLANTRTYNTDFDVPGLTARRTALQSQIASTKSRCQSILIDITGRAAPADASPAEFRTLALYRLRSWTALAEALPEGADSVDFARLRENIGGKDFGALQQQLGVLQARLVELQQLRRSEGEPAEHENAMGLAVALQDALLHTAGPESRKAYEAALAALASATPEEQFICPVCDSRVQSSLADHIRDKLSAYEETSRLENALASTIGGSHWHRTLLRLLATAEAGPTPEDDRRFRTLNGSLDGGGGGIVEVLDSIFDLVDDLRHRLDRGIRELEVRRDAIAAAMPQSTVQLGQQLAQVEQVHVYCAEWEQQQTNLGSLEATLGMRNRFKVFLDQASQSFGTAEVALSTNRVSALEGRYRPMYGRITNEPEVVPKLAKRPNSEELFLTLERFYGTQNVQAGALLSESFRNALAMSVYLSAALETPTNCGFIVLDDVTSSFDGGHQWQLIEELRRSLGRPHNQAGFQIIFLSHDGLLEKYFDRASHGSDWRHFRLSGTPPTGSIESAVRSAGYLRTKVLDILNAGSTDGAGPAMRQYLESVLLEIVRNTKVRVPIDLAHRDDNKMAGELLIAIGQEIAVHTSLGTLLIPQPVANRVTGSLVPAIATNLTTHYATGVSSGIAVGAFRGALQNIDDLGAAFKHPCQCSGHSPARYYRTLSTKACACQ